MVSASCPSPDCQPMRSHGPDSIKHVLSFIHLARQTTSNLYLEVPNLSAAWAPSATDTKSFYHAVLREYNGELCPVKKTVAASRGNDSDPAEEDSIEWGQRSKPMDLDPAQSRRSGQKKCFHENIWPVPPLNLFRLSIASSPPLVV